MSDSMRVMRVVLPVEQIRRMDRLILQGAGGFENRNEFLSEAIESLILDLSYPSAEPDLTTDAIVQRHPESRSKQPLGLTIPAVDQGHAMQLPITRRFGPLFGLHNRDYPSIWALWQLSLVAGAGPAPWTSAVSQVTDAAWQAGSELQVASEAGGVITSLFPTNPKKRDAAEGAFREFGIGTAHLEGQQTRTSGPLFEWGVCAVESHDSGLVVGLTEVGWRFLQQMEGLQPTEPHEPAHAHSFVSHLRNHATDDWECFELALRMCDAGSPTRAALVSAYNARLGLDSESVASTYASGYVARCREWGLMEPRQTKGAYVITELGHWVLKG